jgi:GMP reductase
MRIESGTYLDFSDVLIKPKRSNIRSREDINLKRTYTFINSKKVWKGLPIMAANMGVTGVYPVAKALAQVDSITALHKFWTNEDYVKLRNNATITPEHVAVTVGEAETEINNLIDNILPVFNFKFICLDAANGYRERFVKAMSTLREKFPDKVIIAGNVATAEMTETLILAGADIVKVGIGPGIACTTRKTTGIGVPQLSAVIDCADAAHGLGGHIIADGGLRTSGDVVKAFAAGADFVMMGGMFAGTSEAEGDIVTVNGKAYKNIYGMSSTYAQKKHYNEVKNYRASEGTEALVEHVGSVADLMKEITGGLRSACTYVGAARLKDLSKCTTFIPVNRIHDINN